MEKEILAAEIYLHPVDVDTATADIDAELAGVERALKAYSVSASLLDYSIAVLSGILSGQIDALFVKDTILQRNDLKPDFKQLGEIVKNVLVGDTAFDKKSNLAAKVLTTAKRSETLSKLEAAAVQPNPKGLIAAVLAQAWHGGILTEKDNGFQFFPKGMSRSDDTLLAVAAAFVGIMKWLGTIAKEEKDGMRPTIRLKGLEKLCALIRSAPAYSNVVDEIERWQKQLPDEIKNNRKQNPEDAGVEKVFYSFFTMMAGIPVFSSFLPRTVNLIQNGKRLGLDEIPIIKCLTRQAIPVLINEVIVRTFYFVSRLVQELAGTEDISRMNWEKICPFGNRSIDRLLTIASLTLSVADTADASMHLALDYCSTGVLNPKTFITRFNFAAAGRAAIAVVKEISYEKQEEQLLHMKRLLAEEKTAKALEILRNYQEQLETRVSEYLVEDIEAFLKGFESMDQGLAAGDSNLVIRGNVMIQRVLGREVQFTSQQEFDDLMDSDTPLIL